MPLASYRVSAEGFLRWECNDRVVSGLRWEQKRGPEVMLLAARVVTGLREIHSQAAERPPNSFWTASCASLGLS